MKKYVVGVFATICFVVLVSGCTSMLPTTLKLNNANSTSVNENITTINITGVSEPNATVTVDGEAATVDANGNFYKVVSLASGANNITVTAQAPEKAKVSTYVTVTKTVENGDISWKYFWNGNLTIANYSGSFKLF